MQGKEYFLETKFDGERMQLHKQDREYKYFSRRYAIAMLLYKIVGTNNRGTRPVFNS